MGAVTRALCWIQSSVSGLLQGPERRAAEHRLQLRALMNKLTSTRQALRGVEPKPAPLFTPELQLEPEFLH